MHLCGHGRAGGVYGGLPVLPQQRSSVILNGFDVDCSIRAKGGLRCGVGTVHCHCKPMAGHSSRLQLIHQIQMVNTARSSYNIWHIWIGQMLGACYDCLAFLLHSDGGLHTSTRSLDQAGEESMRPHHRLVSFDHARKMGHFTIWVSSQ